MAEKGKCGALSSLTNYSVAFTTVRKKHKTEYGPDIILILFEKHPEVLGRQKLQDKEFKMSGEVLKSA